MRLDALVATPAAAAHASDDNLHRYGRRLRRLGRTPDRPGYSNCPSRNQLIPGLWHSWGRDTKTTRAASCHAGEGFASVGRSLTVPLVARISGRWQPSDS